MTGPQCRKLREKAGLSVLAFSRRAGVAYATVQRHESGATIRKDAAFRLDRAYAAIAPASPTQTGYAIRGVRPGAMDKDDPAAEWNGHFDRGWLRSQIRAWARDGVTVAEMRRGDTASAPSTVYIATEAQLTDFGRRLGVALTGKNLQE